jgi:hypothetical protein
MDKAQHARLLRDAIATSREHDRRSVSDRTGKGYRTVSNWISESDPTMPRDEDLVVLREMFPGYDQAIDPVERAVRGSRLTEDRQYGVIGFYKRQLREQDEAAERGATG